MLPTKKEIYNAVFPELWHTSGDRVLSSKLIVPAISSLLVEAVSLNLEGLGIHRSWSYGAVYQM